MSPQDSPQRPWSAGATAPGPGALHSPPREPTLAPPGSRHRPVISSRAESRQAGLRPAELARATETCVHATACTGHLGCVGPWAGGILQTEMRRGRPSRTRSVVRAPLAFLLVPSFRAWIPVATGALLPAAFHPAASRSSRHICPSAQDLPLASHLEPSKQQSSPGVCEAPRALAPMTTPVFPRVTPPTPLASLGVPRTSLRALALCLRPGHSPRNPCGALSPPPSSG